MISIIGSGKVGSAIAFLCGSNGLDDITLINRTEKKAIGEALDISNTIPENSSISIRGTGNFSKISGSDVVVIAASSGTYLVNRTERMFDQAVMVEKITDEIAKFAPESKILLITNPVDVLTFLTLKKDVFPSKNVIGVASNLDSSRFQHVLAQEFGTDRSKITDAMVLGEHDDSMVPIFSLAKVNGKPITSLLDAHQQSIITSKVRNYWKELRANKGPSVFGIAKNTYDIIQCVIKKQTLTVVASTLLDGQYGLENVCVGVPVTITKDGIVQINQITLTSEEKQQLHKSAGVVKNNITKVQEFLKTSR